MLRRAELNATGTRAFPHKLVALPEMEALAAGYRQQGKTLVLTNGCFDMLHVGHVNYLSEAAAEGDVLVVAVNSDTSVRGSRGRSAPSSRRPTAPRCWRRWRV